MIVFKCKMCGGDLAIREGSTVCECEYCGSVQTTPVMNSDKKMNLFNRANRLRMNSEFDKAAAIYAAITAEFPQEAEAYWGLCLCKYGIEYVDDPLTGNKIPTCHRTLTTSVLNDSDFIQATEYADSAARPVYESEGKRIDALQQDILQIVRSESPYDVFICYKETDESGDRTEDSVLAQEIYDSLTKEGLKVFFARITLEDKLGQQYEPYIFAALQSAKVMLAVGTSYENLDAVWVKNEWSRFLEMMKTDRTKKLIPCFKGMDIDEMPKAFQRLQAQDLSKLGWIQDLTRGVKKICGVTQGPVNVRMADPGKAGNLGYLDRASVFLEDGLWEKASFYADKEIAHDPSSSKAYQIKLLAELQVKNPEELRKKDVLLFENENFKKALQYSEGKDREELEKIDRELTDQGRKKCVEKITRLNDRMANATAMHEYYDIEDELNALYEFPEVAEFRDKFAQAEERFKDSLYHKAQQMISKGEYEEALEVLDQLPDYKDTQFLTAACDSEISKQNIYNQACDLMRRRQYEEAFETFQNLGDYRDSAKLSKKCAGKRKIKTTIGHKVAIGFHLFYIILMLVLIGIYIPDAKLPGMNIIWILILILLIIFFPILAYKFDRRKKPVRVVIDFVICAVAFYIFLMPTYSGDDLTVPAIGTVASIILTIFL